MGTEEMATNERTFTVPATGSREEKQGPGHVIFDHGGV